MSAAKQLLTSLVELRKAVRILGLLIILGTLAAYFSSPTLLGLIQQSLNQKLAFFTVAEPFLAHVKLAFFFTLFVLMPAILYAIWKAMGKTFALSATASTIFTLTTCVLFYCGAFFCYFITLPFGIKFLLGFQTVQLQPLISINKFVNFVTMFILAFGTIFELPIVMVFSAKVNLISRRTFEQSRRYAVLIISVMAALLTPTPDIMNMLLMGGPLYLLYELGILILRVMKIEGRRQKEEGDPEPPAPQG